MKSKQSYIPDHACSIAKCDLEILDPLRNKAGLPPTQGQIEAAEKLDIALTVKNPDSASMAIAKARRDLAEKLITLHELESGIHCTLDGKTSVVITMVGGSIRRIGSVILVKARVPPIRA